MSKLAFQFLEKFNSDGNFVLSPKNIRDCFLPLFKYSDESMIKKLEDFFSFKKGEEKTPDLDENAKSVISLWISKKEAEGKTDLESEFITEFVDFAKASTVEEINTFVKDYTSGKIDKAVESIPQDCPLAVVSAIYFKGGWKVKFNEAETKKQPFYSNGKASSCEMMVMKSKYGYYEAEGITACKVPYSNGFSMIAVLSEKGLQEADYNKISFAEREVVLMMPKFKISSSLDLLPFITEKVDPKKFSYKSIQGLEVGSITHKAFVETDEKGTEAAAVTFLITKRSMSMPVAPVIFRLDKPFNFFIVNDSTNEIWFLGKINKPSA